LDSTVYRCGDLLIDPGNRRVVRGDAELALEPKVFAVILQLLGKPGSLVARNALLDAVWGHRYVTPSTLNRLIALARRAFADDSEEPRFIQTVHGAGYRYIGPIELETTVGTTPVARFAPPPLAHLPARVEALIGREHELQVLASLLAAHRAVTVLGTGGLGKTQCVLEFARLNAGAYPDGVWFFDLAPMRQADEWLRALAAALSIPPTGNPDLLQKCCALLRDRRALFVVDNCDRIAAETGGVAVDLLRHTEHLKLLATSQALLNFSGEQVMRLPPLAFPQVSEGNKPTLQQIESAPAVRLLLTRINTTQPGFALNSVNAATMVEICRRLDGMPLALELAAARFALLSPDQVLERLQHGFRFLSSDMAGRDARHRNLLALLDWSVGLLAPREQQLLGRMSVFVQGWTMDAAIAVAADISPDPETVVELLTGLATKSLVAVDSTLSPPRYRLLETVREYALDKLHASGEEARAREAHLAYFVQLSEAAHGAALAGHARETVPQIMYEHGNIAAAINYAIATEANSEAAMIIVGSLILYFKMRGLYISTREWCERALSGKALADSIHRGRAMLTLALSRFYLQQSPEAAFVEAIRILDRHGDDWAHAFGCGHLALWYINENAIDAATRRLDVTARIADRLGDATLQGLAGLVRGWLLLARGESSEALAVLRSVRRMGHDPHQHLFIEIYVGLAQVELGQYAAAAVHLHEVIVHSATLASPRLAAGAIEGCAYIACRSGDIADAVRCLSFAGRLRERTHAPLFRLWHSHHERTMVAIRTALGPAGAEASLKASDDTRDEDAITEVTLLLRRYRDGMVGKSTAIVVTTA
jgi:predicted ATPase/DNA-binding winged helix-turn-helix (wHTH) protein